MWAYQFCPASATCSSGWSFAAFHGFQLPFSCWKALPKLPIPTRCSLSGTARPSSRYDLRTDLFLPSLIIRHTLSDCSSAMIMLQQNLSECGSPLACWQHTFLLSGRQIAEQALAVHASQIMPAGASSDYTGKIVRTLPAIDRLSASESPALALTTCPVLIEPSSTGPGTCARTCFVALAQSCVM